MCISESWDLWDFGIAGLRASGLLDSYMFDLLFESMISKFGYLWILEMSDDGLLTLGVLDLQICFLLAGSEVYDLLNLVFKSVCACWNV